MSDQSVFAKNSELQAKVEVEARDREGVIKILYREDNNK